MEDKQRREALVFLLEAGTKLELRCETIARASVIYHRFTNKVPTELDELCLKTVASSCLYLAGKVEEDVIKIRDVVNVCHRMCHQNEEPLPVDELYWDLRDGIGELEVWIARTLAFKLTHPSLPHKLLLQYTKSVVDWMDRTDSHLTTILSNTAWTILRDTFVDPSILTHYSPQILAIAVLRMTLNIYNIHLKCETPWHLSMHPKAESSVLIQVEEDILSRVYQSTVLPFHASN